MKFFVYVTTNKVNGKKYIGKHTGSLDDEYLGSGAVLKKAIAKYGKQNFERDVLGITEDADALDVLERFFIEKFNAANDPSYYNIADGGTGGNTLRNLSEDRLAERSKKIKQYFEDRTEEEKAEHRNRMSKVVKASRRNPTAEARRIQAFKKNYQGKTPEQRLEQYNTRRGGKAYQAKPVVTPLGEFLCAKHAAEVHDVNIQTVLNRCRNKNFPDWNLKNG